MSALWDDPPYVRDPSTGIPEGKFRVTKLDTFDHDEYGCGLFDSFAEALAFAREKATGAGTTRYRIWNHKQEVLQTL